MRQEKYESIKAMVMREESDPDKIEAKVKAMLDPTCSKAQAEYEKHLYGDFVPYSEGVRIRDTIYFSVKLQCRCPELNIDV